MKKRFFLALIVVLGLAASSFIHAPTSPEIPTPETIPLFAVVRIIDGDTIVVDKNGSEETVRLLGIDTPEVDPDRGGPECYGKEASEKTTNLLLGQSISLETDPTQDERDRYNRMLAYVSLSDGTLINKLLVEGGFAKEYTYDKPYTYQADFKAAEANAKKATRGLWSKETCPTR
ncbi:MAG: hypothetical protein RLZZ480_881 [Candidatus Parcubacteria bacterium]|jgi:micrococcal nuclease